MAIETVNIGSAPNDGMGDPLRTAFNKLNTNFLNITADGGDEITVTDPTTSTDGTLNDALANIYASGGTPDLQAVTDENLNVYGYAETTNGIQTSKLIAENFQVDSALEYFDFAGSTPNFHYTPTSGLIIQDNAQENGVVLFQSGLLQFIKNSFSTDLEPTATTARFLYLPDKDGTLAITDDITALDLQAITDVNNTITDGTNTMYLNASSIEIQGIVNQMQILSDQLIFSDGVNNSSYFLGFINNNGVNYLLPTGTSSQIATLLDIPTLDATPTNGSTNGVESNGVFDALALKANASRFVHNGETSITGTSTESNICSFKIPASAYSSNDGFKLDATFTKGVTAGSITFRVYFGTSSGARTNLIGQNGISNTGRASDFTRRYYINSGNINTSVGFTSNAAAGLGTQTAVNTPIAIDTANDVWITITAQGQTSGETVGILGASITPLK